MVSSPKHPAASLGNLGGQKPEEKATAPTEPATAQPTAASPPPPNTATWLTREESAHLLGVSVQTIKNYEKKGVLWPQQVARRDILGRTQTTAVYDPRELSKVRDTILKGKPEPQDTSTWLTRNECAELMSVSTQTLKNYEQRGMLHPVQVPRKDARNHEQMVVVYNPKEIVKLPRGLGTPFVPREIGELNARAYELFAQGKDVWEIVIELRETSEKIRDLYEKWLDDKGAKFVITPQTRETLVAVLGPFADVTEMVTLVMAKLSKPSGDVHGNG